MPQDYGAVCVRLPALLPTFSPPVVTRMAPAVHTFHTQAEMLCRKTMELCDKLHGMANTNKPKHLIQVTSHDSADRK